MLSVFKQLVKWGWVLVLMSLSGCASLPAGYELPVVNVRGVRTVSDGGVVPGFEIDLHVINPNRTALRLDGVFYTVDLEGHRILSGVASQLPSIPAYGEDVVTLNASVDLLSGINLLSELMSQPRSEFNYDLNAKLDLAGFRRSIKVDQQGLISLPRSR